MNDALKSGELDFVGVARPFALAPDLPNQIQTGTYKTIELKPIRTGVAKIDEQMGSVLEMGWCMCMGSGKSPCRVQVGGRIDCVRFDKMVRQG